MQKTCGVSVMQCWEKKAITHERPGKTMSEELPNQTFQTESGMISRTGETSETTVLVWKHQRHWPHYGSHLGR